MRVVYLPTVELFGEDFRSDENHLYLPRDVSTIDLDDLDDTHGVDVNAENHTRVDTHPSDAGLAVGGGPVNPPNDTIQMPGHPFRSVEDHSLAEWFITNRISQSAINGYYRLPGVDKSGPTSAYSLLKDVDRMDGMGLGADSWRSGKVTFLRGVPETELREVDWTSYWYRDPVDAIRFLLGQKQFAKELVWAPVREYGHSGDRIYSEMHTANWWWNEQVCLETPLDSSRPLLTTCRALAPEAPR
jgi:hypothetical protein